MTEIGARLQPLLLGALGIVIAGGVAYALVNPPPMRAAYLDFNSFYCAAGILSRGQDPYRYEPLHSCEIRNLHPVTPNAVVPAPLPPYAIAAFMPFTKLSYPRAQFAWWLVLVAGAAVILGALLALTGLPLLLIGTCVSISILLPSLIVGSLALVPIALLSLSGLAIVRQRWVGAAVLQGAACIEPHLALPVLVATFAFVPQMRPRLAFIGALLLAASIAAAPIPLGIEYLTKVLPAHAVSEINNGEQYALSATLHAFGLSEPLSVSIGEAQYALFALAGLWTVARVRNQLPESVVFVPMALAVMGGPFVHLTQIGAALPLALIVAARTRSAPAWAAVALLAIAIPWQAAIGYGGVLAGLVLFAILSYNRIPWPSAVAAAITAGIVLQVLQLPEIINRRFVSIASVPPATLAELPWRQLASQFSPTPFSWYGHVLIYAAFTCAYCALLVPWRVEHA